MYPALAYSATYMLCTHNCQRQTGNIPQMSALFARMDLISDPEHQSRRELVGEEQVDAFVFDVSRPWREVTRAFLRTVGFVEPQA